MWASMSLQNSICAPKVSLGSSKVVASGGPWSSPLQKPGQQTVANVILCIIFKGVSDFTYYIGVVVILQLQLITIFEM